MSQGDRKCIVCGKEYKFCHNCGNDDRKDETWRNIFCSEDCKNIYNILSMQGNGHIDNSKAKEMLAKCDLSRLDQFRDDFKKQIESINKTDNPQPEKQVEPSRFQKPFQPKQKNIVKEDSKK